jgi:8-amino-7-oxononanoate synthase
LHLFFDLFEMLRQGPVSFYIDAGAYPIARWAVQRAAAFGVRVRSLPHFSAEAARRIVAMDAASGLRPVIVADGFCAICGRPAPIRDYLQAVETSRGHIVLDDTQGLGIWGAEPSLDNPYGKGGGGSLRRQGVRSPRLILGSSLAKGFGVPMAVLSGSASLIRRFERCSGTRIHASPPSMAVLSAAEHALSINALHGDTLRRRLSLRVALFRCQLSGVGLRLPSTLFPTQGMLLDRSVDPHRVQQHLEKIGVDTAVVRGCADPRDRLVFILNTTHSLRDIRSAAAALAAVRLDRRVRRPSR